MIVKQNLALQRPAEVIVKRHFVRVYGLEKTVGIPWVFSQAGAGGQKPLPASSLYVKEGILAA